MRKMDFPPNRARICDIIIDIKRLFQQKGIRTLEDEYRAVLIHGLLHLVGYDHIRSEDAEKLKKKEESFKTDTR